MDYSPAKQGGGTPPKITYGTAKTINAAYTIKSDKDAIYI